MDFLTNWGLEILFALISAGVIGWAKWQVNKFKAKLDDADQWIRAQEVAKIESSIEVHVDPLRQELEDLRNYINEQVNIEKSHMNLIIASYRFRLIQLCKGHIANGYISSSDLEALMEFYKVYVGLGGNGMAKDFYEHAINLPNEKPKQ